jgi:hypothetical protein
MQTPSVVLNIGADVAKDTIAVACSEGSFPVREIANQRTAVLAFLKSLPAGSRIGVESTGTYHELFAAVAHQPVRLAGLPAQSQGYPPLCQGRGTAGQDRSCGCRTDRPHDRPRAHQAARLDPTHTAATRD